MYVPIATLAISQAGGPFLGIARIGGMLLLTWLVLQLGTVLASQLLLVDEVLRAGRGSRNG